MWQLLNAGDQALVRDPSGRADLEGARYPLGVAQLARLVDASERQVRHWAEIGLLPHRREANGYRSFYPAAAIRGFVLARTPQPHLTTLRDIANPEHAPALLASLSSMLAQTAHAGAWGENRALAIAAARALEQLAGILPAEPAASGTSTPAARREAPAAKSVGRTRGTPQARKQKTTGKISIKTYTVERDAERGGWVVKKPNARQPVGRFKTQREATRRATALLQSEGGGERILHGRDGRIRDIHTVSPTPKLARHS
jgi:hypothetical protein